MPLDFPIGQHGFFRPIVGGGGTQAIIWIALIIAGGAFAAIGIAYLLARIKGGGGRWGGEGSEIKLDERAHLYANIITDDNKCITGVPLLRVDQNLYASLDPRHDYIVVTTPRTRILQCQYGEETVPCVIGKARHIIAVATDPDALQLVSDAENFTKLNDIKNLADTTRATKTLQEIISKKTGEIRVGEIKIMVPLSSGAVSEALVASILDTGVASMYATRDTIASMDKLSRLAKKAPLPGGEKKWLVALAGIAAVVLIIYLVLMYSRGGFG